MTTQWVAYWSLGISDQLGIVPLPVLTRIDISTGELLTETVYEAAKSRDVTVLLEDGSLFPVNEFGIYPLRTTIHIINYKFKIDNSIDVQTAIQEIKRRQAIVQHQETNPAIALAT
jgi:hypothetical protein